jgi:hypothetical protein
MSRKRNRAASWETSTPSDASALTGPSEPTSALDSDQGGAYEPSEPIEVAASEAVQGVVLEPPGAPEATSDVSATPGDDSKPPPTAPVIERHSGSRGQVLCRVIGPGSVKSHGRFYPPGSEAMFDARDADRLPQLQRL